MPGLIFSAYLIQRSCDKNPTNGAFMEIWHAEVMPAVSNRARFLAIEACVPCNTPCNTVSNLGVADDAFAVGSGFNNSVRKIVHTEDVSGDIYAVGEFTSYQDTTANGLVRLNNDGSRETSFFTGTGFSNSDGPVAFGEFASSALAADASSDIYVAGDFTDYDGTTADGIVRLNDDGSLDPVFEARISSETGTCTNGNFVKDD